MTLDPRTLGARCDSCPLRGSTPVFASPPRSGKARLVIVGEGPGRTEEARGQPFIGKSGALLDEALAHAGISRDDTFVTNACLCRTDMDKVAEQAAACCAPRLLREVAGVGAPVLALGRAAVKTLLDVGSIQLSRGFIWTGRDLREKVDAARKNVTRLEKRQSAGKPALGLEKAREKLETLSLRNQLAGRTIFPSVHPAFVMRSDAWRALFELDVARVGRWLRGEVVREDDIQKVDDLEDFKRRSGVWLGSDDPGILADALDSLGPVVSCDIETDGVNPLTANIICVGVSNGSQTVVIDPWTPSVHGVLLTRALMNREVVFHNGYNFDQIALERDGVIFFRPPEDTLLAHHAFASHFPQRLDHVASTFCDSSPWKIVHGRRGAAGGDEEKGKLPKDMSPEERDYYNAQDCVLTALSWKRMQADLEPERGVYEADKKLAILCKKMQVEGIAVDEAGKDRLSGELRERAGILKAEMRRVLGWEEFNPARPAHVREALYDRLKAPILVKTEKGLPSTSEEVLESLKAQDSDSGRFATAQMNWRLCEKVRGTYVDPIPLLLDYRAHYNWKPFGTVSGRLAGRLQSCPRYGKLPEQRPRELYVARGTRGEGTRLVAQIHDAAILECGETFIYFDLSQAEARAAAYLSGDQNLIEAVQEDYHLANALVAFGGIAETKERLLRGQELSPFKGANGKPLKWKAVSRTDGGCQEERDIAKNFGFCIHYGGGAAKLYKTLTSKGFPATMRGCMAAVNRFDDRYYRYNRWCAKNLDEVRRVGYMRSALIRRFRWLGYYPSETDVRNYPIQSLIADVMNTRLVELEEGVRRMNDPEEVKSAILSTWARPVVIRKSELVSEDREFALPAEVKMGERWSSF